MFFIFQSADWHTSEAFVLRKAAHSVQARWLPPGQHPGAGTRLRLGRMSKLFRHENGTQSNRLPVRMDAIKEKQIMIPERLIEDLAPRLSFLDDFASRSFIFSPAFLSSPIQTNNSAESDSNKFTAGCEDEFPESFPSNTMSILALKGRCLAMCMYSTSMIIEGKKKSFSVWNAWVRSSENTRKIRSAELIFNRTRLIRYLCCVFRGWITTVTHFRNRREKINSLRIKSSNISIRNHFEAWGDKTYSIVICKSSNSEKANKKLKPCPNSILHAIRYKTRSSLQVFSNGVPLVSLMIYGANLARIIRKWSEFSRDQIDVVEHQILSLKVAHLSQIMKSWTTWHCESQIKKKWFRNRSVKFLLSSIFMSWKSGIFCLHQNRFEACSEAVMHDSVCPPSYYEPKQKSIKNAGLKTAKHATGHGSDRVSRDHEFFEQSCLQLGHVQFRVLKAAIDDWKLAVSQSQVPVEQICFYLGNSFHRVSRGAMDKWKIARSQNNETYQKDLFVGLQFRMARASMGRWKRITHRNVLKLSTVKIFQRRTLITVLLGWSLRTEILSQRRMLAVKMTRSRSSCVLAFVWYRWTMLIKAFSFEFPEVDSILHHGTIPGVSTILGWYAKLGDWHRKIESRAFQNWTKVYHGNKRAKRVVLCLTAASRSRLLYSNWMAWKWLSENIRSKRGSVSEYLLQAKYTLLIHLWIAWTVQSVSGQKFRVRLANAVNRKFYRVNQFESIRKWANRIYFRNLHRSIQQTIQIKHNQMCKENSLLKLRQNIIQRKQWNKAMRFAFVWTQQARFKDWVRFSCWKKCISGCLKKALRLKQGFFLSRALETLKNEVIKTKHMARAAEKVVYKTLSLSASSAINMWVTKTSNAKLYRQLLSRVTLRTQICWSGKCFRWWKERPSLLKKHRKLLLKCLSRTKDVFLRKRFFGWMHLTGRVRRINLLKGSLDRMVRKIHILVLARALVFWRLNVVKIRGISKAAQRIICKTQQVCVKSAWQVWVISRRLFKGTGQTQLDKWSGIQKISAARTQIRDMGLKCLISAWYTTFKIRSARRHREARAVIRVHTSCLLQGFLCWGTLLLQGRCLRRKGTSMSRKTTIALLARTMTAWYVMTSRSLQVTRVARKAIFKLGSRQLQKAMTGWTRGGTIETEQAERKYQYEKISKFMSRRQLTEICHSMTACTNHWFNIVRSNRHYYIKVVRVAKKIRIYLLQTVFGIWIKKICRDGHLKYHHRSFNERLQRSKTVKSLLRWRQTSHQRWLLHRTASRTACGVQTRMLRSVIDGWSKITNTSLNLKRTLVKSAARNCNLASRRILCSWQDITKVRLRCANAVKRTTTIVKTERLRAIYWSWKTEILNSKRHRFKLACAVRKSRGNLIAKMVASWLQCVIRSHVTAQAIKNVLCRLQNPQLRLSLGQWLHPKSCCNLRKYAAISTFLCSRSVRLSRYWFDGWCQHQKLAQKQRRCCSLTLGIAARTDLRRLGSGFLHWLEIMYSERRHQAKTGLLKCRFVGRVFRSWTLVKIESQGQALAQAKLQHRMLHRALVASIIAWIAFVSFEHERQFHFSRWTVLCRVISKNAEDGPFTAIEFLRAWQCLTSQQRQCRRRKGRLDSLTMRVSMQSWMSKLQAQRQCRRAVEGALTRIMGRYLRTVVGIWKAQVVWGKLLKSSVQRAIRHKQGKSGSEAFAAWREAAGRARLRAATARNAVFWSLHWLLRSAALAWASRISDTRRQRRALRAALTRMRPIRCGKAFQSWCDSRMRGQVLGVALARIGLVVCSTAFRTWCEASDTQQRSRAVSAKFAARAGRQHMLINFDLWANRARQVGLLRQSLGEVIKRTQVGLCAETLRNWQEAAAEERRIARVMRSAILRMRLWRLGSVLFSWRTCSSEMRRLRQAFGGLIARTESLVCREYLSTWCEAICLLRWHQCSVRGAVTRMLRRVCCVHFICWVEMTRRMKRVRHTSESMLWKLKGTHARRALDSWREAADRAQRMVTAGRRVICRMRQGLLGSVVERWRAAVRERGWNRSRLMDTLGSLAGLQASAVFSEWRNASHSGQLRRKALVRVDLRVRARLGRVFFLGWRDAQSRRKRTRAIGARCLGRARRRGAGAALLAWSQRRLVEARLRFVASKISSRARIFAAADALLAWDSGLPLYRTPPPLLDALQPGPAPPAAGGGLLRPASPALAARSGIIGIPGGSGGSMPRGGEGEASRAAWLGRLLRTALEGWRRVAAGRAALRQRGGASTSALVVSC